MFTVSVKCIYPLMRTIIDEEEYDIPPAQLTRAPAPLPISPGHHTVSHTSPTLSSSTLSSPTSPPRSPACSSTPVSPTSPCYKGDCPNPEKHADVVYELSKKIKGRDNTRDRTISERTSPEKEPPKDDTDVWRKRSVSEPPPPNINESSQTEGGQPNQPRYTSIKRDRAASETEDALKVHFGNCLAITG